MAKQVKFKQNNTVFNINVEILPGVGTNKIYTNVLYKTSDNKTVVPDTVNPSADQVKWSDAKDLNNEKNLYTFTNGLNIIWNYGEVPEVDSTILQPYEQINNTVPSVYNTSDVLKLLTEQELQIVKIKQILNLLMGEPIVVKQIGKLSRDKEKYFIENNDLAPGKYTLKFIDSNMNPIDNFAPIEENKEFK